MRKLVALIFLCPVACHAPVECNGVPISTGHFIVADAALSGHSARLALDPIRNVLLDRQFADTAGIDVLSAQQVGYEGRVSIGGAGAEQQEPGFAVGLELQAGDMSRELPPVVVVDLRSPLGPAFTNIDGLLGTDLFGEHVLDINIPAGCLEIVPRDRFQAPETQALAVERMRNRPVVKGSIEFPNGERHELSFLLDFGMSGGVRLSTRFVDEHALDEQLQTTVPERMETGLGGNLRSLETNAAAVELGDARWQNLPIRLARETEGADANPPWDALVGVGLLKTRHIVYDAAADRFWILPAGQ
jgi:hypothetical protein